jgi:hypothetical protein
MQRSHPVNIQKLGRGAAYDAYYGCDVRPTGGGNTISVIRRVSRRYIFPSLDSVDTYIPVLCLRKTPGVETPHEKSNCARRCASELHLKRCKKDYTLPAAFLPPFSLTILLQPLCDIGSIAQRCGARAPDMDR